MNITSVFDKVLGNVLVKPSSIVRELNLLSERDIQQIFEWNAALPEKVQKCIHEVIEDQAFSRPASEAVCAWDGRFTYQDLDLLASRLARHLEKLGVGPETRVPLCFSKSVSIL